jgi:ABC-type arginine/histidine transport system permease subunit
MILAKAYSLGLPYSRFVLTGRDLTIDLVLLSTVVGVGILSMALDLLRAARNRYLQRGSSHQFLSGRAKSFDRVAAAKDSKR